MNPHEEPNTWNISEMLDYVYNFSIDFICVNQTVEVSDIYAPLAGTGTAFRRIWLCLPSGQPIFFFSDEGSWWIS